MSRYRYNIIILNNLLANCIDIGRAFEVAINMRIG